MGLLFRFFFCSLCVWFYSFYAEANGTSDSQMEKLNRGLIVFPYEKENKSNCIVSWRLLGTDPDNVSFDIYKNDKRIAKNIKDKTFYKISDIRNTDKFHVVAKNGRSILDKSQTIAPWDNFFWTIKLDRPQPEQIHNSRRYEYFPNDCSVGDVDGDGEYEIIVKWDPGNSHDNSHRGFTGKVYIDCYKLNGTKLWRINLGNNIRAGAHYTQFMVYDFDCDGKAEMMCKTAPGTIDGKGLFVSEAADDDRIKYTDNQADYRNRDGSIMDGPEFLTIFDGLTGSALHTVYYNPNRNGSLGDDYNYPNEYFWGDANANRSERYLACVAYLDGPDQIPAAVFARGYYTRAYLWAVQFINGKIKTKWLHESATKNLVRVTDENGILNSYEYNNNTFDGRDGYTCFAQGAHSIAVGDVDADGMDEIMFGAAAVDQDGMLLYSTGLGHGDAIHLSDLDPDRPGLEFFMPHEHWPYGVSLRDAKTGEKLYYETSSEDNGRGLAADIDPEYRGFEFWSAANRNIYNVNGKVVANNPGSINFRIYWDDDPYDELFDRGHITKWNGNKMNKLFLPGNIDFTDILNSRTCNGSKATPNLIADIFGDWREELVLWSSDDCSTLVIFTSNIMPKFRMPTLMHDHLYRMSVCWQNVAYNQPPHLGYYLPDSVNVIMNK